MVYGKLPDIVNRTIRSRMMAGIKSKNTKPELMIRHGLHRMGYRYKLHDKSLPGKPDIVFPMYSAVIQVHGCFWHGHECHLFKWPSTRKDFWKNKITETRKRDTRNLIALDKIGWRSLVIWECAIKGSARLSIAKLLDQTSYWLSHRDNSKKQTEIPNT